MYKRLKVLRKSNKFTQEFIATQLHISQSLYSKYENGCCPVPTHILSKIAKFYNTSIDYLVGDTNQFAKHSKI